MVEAPSNRGNVGSHPVPGLTSLESQLLAKGLRKHAKRVRKYARKHALTRGDEGELKLWARRLDERADQIGG
jgi:hypothetical protein